MFLQLGLVCFVVFMTCFNAAACPVDDDEATDDHEPVLGLVPKISEDFDVVKESPHLSIRQTCDPKWATLDPRHTMCLTDVGVAVPLDDATKAALVQQHNDLRSQVVPLAANMQELAWDEDLALVSEKWAMQCVVGHDNFTARQVPSLPRVIIGQNGAFGYSTFADSVQAWFDERKDFIYGTGSTGGVVGHYTQVASARAARIGCGQAYCAGRPYLKYYFCNYAVGQNRGDAVKPYKNSTVSCSDCPTKCDDSGKLCDCEGKVCLNGGTFNIVNCTCTCEKPFSGDICQTLTCPKTDPSFCNKNWPPPYCKIFENVPYQCPYMCGICTASG